MADIRRNLSLTVSSPYTQLPIEGATITVRLSAADYTSEGVMLPMAYRAETDENGEATIGLVPNTLGTQSSQYKVAIYDTNQTKLLETLITMPDEDRTLSSLVDSLPPTTLSAAQLAVLSAQTSASEAATSATEAETAQTAAETAQGITQTLRDAVIAAESTVAGYVTTTQGYRDTASAAAISASEDAASADASAIAASGAVTDYLHVDGIANNLAIAANKAGTGLLNLLKANTSDEIEVGDSSAILKLLGSSLVVASTLGMANATAIVGDTTTTGTYDLAQVDSSNRVVIGDATADMIVKGGAITIEGDVTITGDLQTTTANEVNIGDAVILLNAYETGAPAANAGFEIERGTDTNVSFLWNETLDRWEIDQAFHSSGNIIIDKSNPKLVLQADDSSSPMVTYQNASGTDQWALYTSVGASGAQGNFFLYNYNTAVNVFSIDETTNLFTFASATPVQIDNNLTIGGTLGVTGVTSIGSPAGSGGGSYGQLAVKGAANTVYGSWDSTTAGFGYQTILAQGTVVGYLGQGSSVATGVADGLSIRSEGDLELWAGGGNLAVSFNKNTRAATFTPTSGAVSPFHVNEDSGLAGEIFKLTKGGYAAQLQHTVLYHNWNLNTAARGYNWQINGSNVLTINTSKEVTAYGTVYIVPSSGSGSVRYYEGSGDFWSTYHYSLDNSFRINFNALGNDEFNLAQTGQLTLTTVSNYTNQLTLAQSGSNATLYSYADSGGAGWASASGTGYSCLIYMKEAANAIDFYTNGTYAGQWTSSQGLTVLGALSKGSGSFRIPHVLPELKETHDLVHSFVESPRAENLYAGMVELVDGKATVNIDKHSGMTEGTFEALNHPRSWSSSNESGYAPVKCSLSGNILTIECEDATSTDTVYFEVRGERKDQHMLETEWTDKNGRVIVEPLKTEVAELRAA